MRTIFIILIFSLKTLYSQQIVEKGDTIEFTKEVENEYWNRQIFGKRIGGLKNKNYIILKGVSKESKLFEMLSSSEAEKRRKEIEAEKRRKEIEAKKRKIEEKHRIERFLASVDYKLKGDLDPIEGVYKSVNKEEILANQITIFKSTTNSRKYSAKILSSPFYGFVGSICITFEKTAQKDLFLADGVKYHNIEVRLEGALLTSEEFRYIKMYPAEGETRKYSEINPMVDWQTSGSGVLINNKGYIATNNHVINGAKKIRISFQNDTLDYEAKIISQNEENDVAIVKIIDTRFKSTVKPINWNPSISLGEKVFTLGYPISEKMSDNVKVVDGIVSGLNGRDGNKKFFQTTLPVWYGNSGGPCFNSKGEILGLATQILWDKGEKMDNVAYITKTSNVISLAGSFISKDNISKPGLNEIPFEDLIKELIPYSTFIKVNY